MKVSEFEKQLQVKQAVDGDMEVKKKIRPFLQTLNREEEISSLFDFSDALSVKEQNYVDEFQGARKELINERKFVLSGATLYILEPRGHICWLANLDMHRVCWDCMCFGCILVIWVRNRRIFYDLLEKVLCILRNIL